MGSISPLGSQSEDISREYSKKNTFIIPKLFNDKEYYVSALQEKENLEIQKITTEKKAFSHLDRSVILALNAARSLKKNFSPISFKNKKVAINIGSSRGATGIFEEGYNKYLNGEKLSPFTSPTTTLGNLSSWVAQDLLPDNNDLVAIEHSMTCSTFMQGLGNALAWLKSGQSDLFFVGASEAPLTPFTLSQMNALKIYKNIQKEEKYPSRPLGDRLDQKNSMVLGEGAALFLLERFDKPIEDSPLGVIESIGFGMENITSPTSMNKEGLGFQTAMKNALKNMTSNNLPDLIILHAPGTIVGDQAEFHAIKEIFPEEKFPRLTSNKWKIGHTLAASGALSLEMAILILQGNEFSEFPYSNISLNNNSHIKENKKIKKIMINSAGFGGATTSLIISGPEI